MEDRLARVNCGPTGSCRCIPRPLTRAMPMAKTYREWETVKKLRVATQGETVDSATMCWEFLGEEQ